MKRLSRDFGILTPFVAALVILAGSALLYVQEARRLDAILLEQSRVLHVRTELQSVRRVLLEAAAPDWAEARRHLDALADLHARDPEALAQVEAVRVQGEATRAAPAVLPASAAPGPSPASFREIPAASAPGTALSSGLAAVPGALAPRLDTLLAMTESAEGRVASDLSRARASHWQRLWLLLGLGGVLLAYAGVMLVRAVRARSLLGERLQYEAMHDSLTSLPNRRYFMQWAERALAQARRERTQLALLYVDLDGFRNVNDQQGQEVGDRLLRVAARRFRDRVRESDVLARLGSDEFVILTPITTEAASVGALAERLIASLASPLLPQFGDRYPVGASIGIAIYPRDAASPDALLLAAEAAMRAAKLAGRNHYQFALAGAGTPSPT